MSVRTPLLVRTDDAAWSRLLASADAVSEGSARDEGNGRTWYGSTSLVLALPDRTDAERAFFAQIAAHDVHLRLRATRIAHREAASRAPGRLGRLTCEVRAYADPRGLRIDVDVQAPLIEGRGRLHRAPSS